MIIIKILFSLLLQKFGDDVSPSKRRKQALEYDSDEDMEDEDAGYGSGSSGDDSDGKSIESCNEEDLESVRSYCSD